MIFFRFLVVVLVYFLAVYASAADWPQWRGINRDGVWSETQIVDAFPADSVQPVWRTPVGPGYGGVSVADGQVYVMDRIEQLDQERILCFDEKNGKPLWTYEYTCEYSGLSYPLGPRTTVTVEKGRVLALGAMGHLHCLDATSGKIIWKKDLDAEYAIQWVSWGMSASPVVWQNLVIVQFGGADGACVAAFEVATGKEVWKAVQDRPSYSSPVLVNQAGKMILLVFSEKKITALDPDNGRIYWQLKYRLTDRRPRQNVATPIIENEYLFLCSAFDGSQMFRMYGSEMKAEPLWHIGGAGKDGESINPSITTPLLKDGYIYGPNFNGEFCCLDAKTGGLIWKDGNTLPAGRGVTSHLVQNRKRTWIFHDSGELIIAELSPRGLSLISRTRLIEPTHKVGSRMVAWAHPAFASGCVYARNDRELICVDLKKQ